MGGSTPDLTCELSLPLADHLVQTRRDLHRFAETGWTEFRTASKVIHTLGALGWNVSLGRSVTVPDARMGVPGAHVLDRELQRALAQGADPDLAVDLEGGFTGAVATLAGKRPGPVVAIRFDMDANDGDESTAPSHRPAREGFRSVNPGAMHNCGHDGHTAIGLGLARVLADQRDTLAGEIRLIFQPAEEGARGAASIAASGVLKGVDYLVGCHIGVRAASSEVVAGYNNLLATTKFDAFFHGRSAHAALEPHEGRNALLAAVVATQNLLAIPRHGGGETHVNVGFLAGGGGESGARNIVPAEATVKGEVRGINQTVADYMLERARVVLHAASIMYGVQLDFEQTGHSLAASSDRSLAELVQTVAIEAPGVETVLLVEDFHATDDAAMMMNVVQQDGGQATFIGLGANLASGHHTPGFDFDERVLLTGVRLLSAVIARCGSDSVRQSA